MSLSEAANRSMKAAPTTDTGDGWPPPAKPATNSPTAKADAAAADPANAAQPLGTEVDTTDIGVSTSGE